MYLEQLEEEKKDEDEVLIVQGTCPCPAKQQKVATVKEKYPYRVIHPIPEQDKVLHSLRNPLQHATHTIIFLELDRPVPDFHLEAGCDIEDFLGEVMLEQVHGSNNDGNVQQAIKRNIQAYLAYEDGTRGDPYPEASKLWSISQRLCEELENSQWLCGGPQCAPFLLYRVAQ